MVVRREGVGIGMWSDKAKEIYYLENKECGEFGLLEAV